ncbi:MAG: ATP-binding protein [Bacteroidetes bacterium]|nr:ATP-binding protein [Bacteroidota bacterium]
MTKGGLEQIVADGEGLFLEFKHRLPESERVAREVTALANTSGGYLLIGVTDDGNLSGVKDPEEEMYALNHALEKYCTPAIALKSEYIKVSRTRTVVVIKIPLSPVRPHYVRDLSTHQRSVFVRYRDMCIVASREARKLMKQSPETENVLIELGEKERLLLHLLEQVGRVSVHSFAKRARIHPGRASRIIIRMTRAGILLHHIGLNEDYFTAGEALRPNSCK